MFFEITVDIFAAYGLLNAAYYFFVWLLQLDIDKTNLEEELMQVRDKVHNQRVDFNEVTNKLIYTSDMSATAIADLYARCKHLEDKISEDHENIGKVSSRIEALAYNIYRKKYLQRRTKKER